ncbi:cardiolipin synthase A/B [Sphingobium xenophagum]|uniref:Cardiolipin synthase n=1 Tax=Sphingobium xenophagum TaxID=121428 RepID=A0A401J360_SPHXE|nr:cardiolipin synthase A/B [Sphingobium xenophagum]
MFYVPLRKTPAAAVSWLLLIAFLPVPGLFIFLAIGRTKTSTWRRDRFAAIAPDLHRLAAQLRQGIPAVGYTEQVAGLAEAIGHMPAVAGNSLELIADYEDLIRRLIADIDDANRSVHLLAYIFADDQAGTMVIDALARAAERGVSCRVLVDPVGSSRWFRRINQRLRASGVNVRASMPLAPVYRWTRRDLRNHRKLYLIDGRIGYVGSQNLVDPDFIKGIVNTEIMARVTGPAVASCEAVFASDWQIETQESLAEAIKVPESTGKSVLQIMPSGPDYGDEGYRSLLLSLLYMARHHVRIVTPYLIPDDAVLAAFKALNQRGVEVELVISTVGDHPIVRLAQSSYYQELAQAGVMLQVFAGGLLHAKTVTIDDHTAVIGSANLDIRSFVLNDEVSLIIYDRVSVQAVASVLDEFVSKTVPFNMERWQQRGAVLRLAANVARLASPVL